MWRRRAETGWPAFVCYWIEPKLTVVLDIAASCFDTNKEKLGCFLYAVGKYNKDMTKYQFYTTTPQPTGVRTQVRAFLSK